MKIFAKFTGEDGSLGYKNGTEYELVVSRGDEIEIHRGNNAGICIYESLIAFFINWNNIRVLNKR